MEFSRSLIGERLALCRKELNMSQVFVCEYVNVPQSALSNFEVGNGGGMDLFLDLTNFYGKHWDLSNLFHEQFHPIEKSSKKPKRLVDKRTQNKKLVEEKLLILAERLDKVGLDNKQLLELKDSLDKMISVDKNLGGIKRDIKKVISINKKS